jgi:hypothetical protein
MKAFPNGIITNEKGLIVGGQTGMDLRDYFAAAVLPNLVSRGTFGLDTCAVISYQYADAMMRAREETKNETT